MKEKNLKTKRNFVIATALVLCIVGAIGLFLSLGGQKNVDQTVANQKVNPNVSVGEIQKEQKLEPSITVPEGIGEGIQKKDETKTNDIQLTKIAEKPQPPEKPVTAVDTEKPHEKPTDPTLTNPEKKPNVPVKPVEPTKPTKDKPSGGETNSKGETYVPGFGWVKDSGPNVGGKSDSNGDWNKQIGTMN